MRFLLDSLVKLLLRGRRRRTTNNQVGTLDPESIEDCPGDGGLPDEAPVGSNAHIKVVDSSEMPRVRRYGDES